MIDVVVVGGGIVGLHAARRFAEEGYEVKVLERKPEIGNLNCTGHYGDTLLDLMPEAEQLVTNQTNDLRIGNSRGYHSHSRDERIGVTLEREDLDKLAADLAKEEGADIETGCEVTNFENKEEFVSVHTKQEDYRCKLMIGADGVHSFVRDQLGIEKPRTIYEKNWVIEEDASDGTILCDLRYDGLLACRVPKGDTCEYGVKVDSKDQIDKVMSKWVKEQDISSAQIEDVRIGEIPMETVDESVKNRVILAGDAAGQVKYTNASGVVYGMQCVEAAVDSIDVNDKSTFKDYDAGWRKELRADMLLHRMLERFGYTPQVFQHYFMYISSIDKFQFVYDRPWTELKEKLGSIPS